VQGAVKAGWQIAWYTTEKTGDMEAGNETVFCFQKWEVLTKLILGTAIK